MADMDLLGSINYIMRVTYTFEVDERREIKEEISGKGQSGTSFTTASLTMAAMDFSKVTKYGTEVDI